jgi:hypothetical protein
MLAGLSGWTEAQTLRTAYRLLDEPGKTWFASEVRGLVPWATFKAKLFEQYPPEAKKSPALYYRRCRLPGEDLAAFVQAKQTLLSEAG